MHARTWGEGPIPELGGVLWGAEAAGPIGVGLQGDGGGLWTPRPGGMTVSRSEWPFYR